MVSTRPTPRCFYPYITHVINFTRLSSFSACNTKNIREPGDEATNLKEVDKEVHVCVCACENLPSFYACMDILNFYFRFPTYIVYCCPLTMAPLILSDDGGNCSKIMLWY